MDEKYNKKRVSPPIWQNDYHVLTRLYSILKKIKDKYLVDKDISILDYGAGTSPYKGLFLDSCRSYIGVDIKKSDSTDLVVKEGKRLPIADNSLDVILSTQVLEHVSDVDFYLSECIRVLKDKGLLILSTYGIWPYHPHPKDFRRWTKEGLINEIESKGFKVVEIYPALGSFASISQFELLLIAEKLISKGLFAGLLLKLISLIANIYIYLEDKLFPYKDIGDSSLFVICAKKI